MSDPQLSNPSLVIERLVHIVSDLHDVLILVCLKAVRDVCMCLGSDRCCTSASMSLNSEPRATSSDSDLVSRPRIKSPAYLRVGTTKLWNTLHISDFASIRSTIDLTFRLVCILKMDLGSASSVEKGRPSLEAENKKLLGYYDRLEDELDSTSTWIGEDDTSRQSRKWKPSSATVWRWAIVSLQIICSVLVGAALGYVLKPGCTELECVRMTSSYCKLFIVL